MGGADPLRSDCRGWQSSIFNKLVRVGRVVVRQNGNTNDRVRIAEVHRHTLQSLSYPLPGRVAGLGTDFLPGVPVMKEVAYEYGIEGCGRRFVAMRLEWPSEAAA